MVVLPIGCPCSMGVLFDRKSKSPIFPLAGWGGGGGGGAWLQMTGALGLKTRFLGLKLRGTA